MKFAVQWMKRSLGILAVALLTACWDGSALAPVGEIGQQSNAAAPALRGVDLGSCADLSPEGAMLKHRLYATGVQLYRWNGASWVFVAPIATLFANEKASGVVGTHYAGPAWESNSGSKVVGAVAERCTPDANAIPWLQLTAVSATGPGIFDGTTHVLRVNTVGGLAPTSAGMAAGEERAVPYTADYLFYVAK